MRDSISVLLGITSSKELVVILICKIRFCKILNYPICSSGEYTTHQSNLKNILGGLVRLQENGEVWVWKIN